MLIISLVSVNELLNLIDVGSLQFSDLLASLKELESWHAGNTTCLCSLGICINIDLHEVHGSLDSCKLHKLWGDHLAWWAPCGGEVNDGETVLLELLIKFSFGCELLDHCSFFLFFL